ncbi:hypothetical protein [Pseudoglutamicibacter cumminsii]|uniref:hypothetical protein n=1 Tax=Pseudoglutamicibacter cumminsii TaxID=156979 RepID=UPI0026EE9EC6|nr:hypothetical protein [Pseudoglutamicibacter cumminsii]
MCQRAPRVSFAVKAGLGFKVGIGLAAFGFAYAYPVLNTQAADAAHTVVAVASEDSDRNSSMPSLPESSAPGNSDPAGTAPAEPAPTTPSTSEPRTPNPTHPSPTNPSVTHPAPTHPGPTNPGPTDPSATNPSVTHPHPTHPSPTAPSEDFTPSTGPTQGDGPTASASESLVVSESPLDAPAHATTVDTQRSKIHGGPGMATPQGLKPTQAKRVPVVLREVPNGTPPTNGAPTSTKMHVIYKVEKAPEPTLGTVNVEPVADVNETAKGIGTAVGGGIALFAIALWGLLRGRKI